MTKFLVDRMLGQTAKWLRLLGIDAAYSKEESDDELLKRAEEEDRVIITRDKELSQRGRSLLVEKVPAEEIVPQVLENYEVKIDPLSRCSVCNVSVIEVDKESVEEDVPEGIYERHETFWRCPECRRVYWKGSHWEKILEKVEGMTQESESQD